MSVKQNDYHLLFLCPFLLLIFNQGLSLEPIKQSTVDYSGEKSNVNSKCLEGEALSWSEGFKRNKCP